MEEGFLHFIKEAFGLNSKTFVLFLQMGLRGLIIYISSILFVRFNRRFTGIRTPFNFILFIMLGSISAAAVLGEVPFVPVFSVIVFLILLNRIVAVVSFFFPPFERLMKGSVVVLAKGGEIQWQNMKNHLITKRDLFTELHDQLHTDDLSSIDFVVLATDGEIHFIEKKGAFLQKKAPAKKK